MRNLILAALALVVAVSPAAADDHTTVDKMKTDLVGHSMGGREKCWKFQSREQIESLEIEGERMEGGRRVYTIVLKLSDRRVGGMYRAEARVWYTEAGDAWQIEHVALRSLQKIE
jgi:hypothetical protein